MIRTMMFTRRRGVAEKSLVVFTVSVSTLFTLGTSVLCAQAPTTTSVPVTRTIVAGIPVIHKRVTANDVVAVQVYLKGGSAALTPDKAGIENLLGAVITKGTTKYDKDKFSALATSTGTSIGSAATYDWTTFTMQGVRQNWDQAWDLLAQAVVHPTFPEAEVALARGQIEDGLKQRPDDPDTYLEEVADSVVYAGHAYAIDAAGTPGTMAKLTRSDVVDWHKSRLTKSNLLIVVVGNVAPTDLAKKVTEAFGALPATGGEAKKVATVASARGEPALVKRELPTNYIEGVFAAPAPDHPDFAALRVGILILTDRLFEEVRTKRNLTYATFAQLNTRQANRGRIYVTAVNPDTTLRVMLAETKRLAEEPVPEQALKEAINVFATGYFMGQQSNMGQASSLGLWELSGGGYRNAATYVNRLRAVKPADVQRAARTYLKDFRFVVVGDPAKVSVNLLKAP
jgi:zinc protease